MKHFLNFEPKPGYVDFSIEQHNTITLGDSDILFIHFTDGSNRYLRITIETEIEDGEVMVGIKKGNDNIL